MQKWIEELEYLAQRLEALQNQLKGIDCAIDVVDNETIHNTRRYPRLPRTRLQKPRKSKARKLLMKSTTPKPLPPPKDLIALLDLKSHHCRYPYGYPGQPGFGFCGRQQAGHEFFPYCEGHVREARR